MYDSIWAFINVSERGLASLTGIMYLNGETGCRISGGFHGDKG